MIDPTHYIDKCQDSFWNHVTMQVLLMKATMPQKKQGNCLMQLLKPRELIIHQLPTAMAEKRCKLQFNIGMREIKHSICYYTIENVTS